jgi:hypothetical protein
MVYQITLGVSELPKIKLCSACNEVLVCGATEAGDSCWCADYPHIMPIDTENDCLCEACLSKATIEKLKKYPNTKVTEDIVPN